MVRFSEANRQSGGTVEADCFWHLGIRDAANPNDLAFALQLRIRERPGLCRVSRTGRLCCFISLAAGSGPIWILNICSLSAIFALAWLLHARRRQTWNRPFPTGPRLGCSPAHSSRSEAQHKFHAVEGDAVEARGGPAASGISLNTDYVVVGGRPGSKTGRGPKDARHAPRRSSVPQVTESISH